MADNYLERRMEDLRNGSMTGKNVKKTSIRRKGHVNFPFPPKRVLIALKTSDLIVPIVKAFRKQDCKVALYCPEVESVSDLAYKEGVKVSLSKTPDSSLSGIFDSWNGLDIVVCCRDYAEILMKEWIRKKENFPIPDEYTGRLILIEQVDKTDVDNIVKEPESQQSTGLCVNYIWDEISDKEKICQLILFLSLPGNSYLNNMTFNIR